MTIATLHRTLSRTLLVLGVTSLIACGGGGGGGSDPTPVPDTTPNAYSYTATTNADPSAVITSSAVTISGINTATTVTITGGEYSIAGGAFTSAAGTISSGQTIAIRLIAPATNSATASAQLTVGGVAGTFSVTTKADTTPNAFSFEPKTDAELGTQHTSNLITVESIDTAVPISITGGEYSINDGAFTSAAGTVSVSNTVAVRATASSVTETVQNAVVTIGGVSATYAVTTITDTTPPVAEFKFPTPYTMSEATTVKVRGTATDDHAITSVKVVVRSFDLDTPNVTISSNEIAATPKAEGDYSSWTVDVPLTALAENEIKVIATDDRNNVTAINDANKVVIRQADVRSAFPNEVNQFNRAVSLVFDKYDGRNRALVAQSYGNDKNVIAVDLETGRRSIAFTSPDCSLFGLTIDPITKHIFGVCEGNLYEFNLNDGELISSYTVHGFSFIIPNMRIDRNNGRNRLVLLERRESEFSGRIFTFELDTKIFSTISAADQLPPFEYGESFLLDGDNYLVPGSDFKSDFGGQIISVNALDGTRRILSDNSIGTGDLYGGSGYADVPFLSTMVKDSKLNRLFVMENWSSRIFTVDLETFNRKIFSDISYVQPDITRKDAGSIDMEIDETRGHIYLAENRRQSIIIVDSETGAKVILSKSKNDR